MARAAEKAYLTVRERILRGIYPASLRLTEQEIADATGVSEECERRSDGFIERIGNLNSQFHLLIQSFSGNARLATLMPALIEAPLVLRTFATYEPSELLRSASHHIEIVSALDAHDPEWAAAIMRGHIHAAQYSSRRAQDAPPTDPKVALASR